MRIGRGICVQKNRISSPRLQNFAISRNGVDDLISRSRIRISDAFHFVTQDSENLVVRQNEDQETCEFGAAFPVAFLFKYIFKRHLSYLLIDFCTINMNV